jgi:hypothetical protein
LLVSSNPTKGANRQGNYKEITMSKVHIYRFTLYEIASDGIRQSRRWGTRDAIERIGGEVLVDTGTEVDASAVISDMPGLTARDYSPPASAAFLHEARV